MPNRFGLVDWPEVNRRARQDPRPARGRHRPETDRRRTLRVGERQIVEIARALSRRAKLLILDEPTAALSHYEAELLFAFIRRLRDQGVAIIYITHRLDEVVPDRGSRAGAARRLRGAERRGEGHGPRRR